MNSPSDTVRIRPVSISDLDVFFRHQQDTEANDLAKVYPRNRADFDLHWARILNNPAIVARTIECGGVVIGNINCFRVDDETHIGYWIGREFWGKGMTTRALGLFVSEVHIRPLIAHVADDNTASIRVLEKCGFHHIGSCDEPGDDRFMACTELIYQLG